MSARRHRDADQILQKLREERISALYHFTSIENLPWIREMKALCSKQALEGMGRWPAPEPGGNPLSHDLDRHYGNWDRLALNFTLFTPMAYWKKREKHLCFFILSIEAAALDGVSFTDTNAASTGQRSGEGLEGLLLVDFAAIRSRPRPWDKEGWHRPVQAEVLVPDRVDLEYVQEVAFVSRASLEEAERLWGPSSHPPFAVAPRCFEDISSGRNPVIGFAYLEGLLLTDELVDKSNAGAARAHKSHFVRRADARITALASVRALAGTQATVAFHPGGYVSTAEFERSAQYWHWPSVSMDPLPDGPCSVDYRLGNVRWATVEFVLTS